MRLSPRSIGEGQFVVVLPTGVTREAVDAEARRVCRGKANCQMLGWTDPDLVASAMPMTEREVAGLKYSYSLNRNSGLDESTADCSLLPGDRCL